jgi:3-oxoacyl-[acyl-carrier-protein] synthase II
MKKKVVVTGIGAVTPFGIGIENFWKGLKSGKSATHLISLFNADDLPCRVVAEVPDFNILNYFSPQEAKRLPRVVPMAILAVKEALEMAHLIPEKMSDEEKRNVNIIIGSGGGGIDFAEKQYELYFNGQLKKANPYAISSSVVGMVSSEISINFGFRGMSHVISNGCTSSTDAIGYSMDMIRSGRCDIVVSGGADACITHGLLAGYCLMRALPTHFNDKPEKASRPFNIDREGFVFGEGAWILVMESEENAKKRGANILVEINGYGSTCEAYHRVALKSDGVESARAMTLAMKDAEISKDEIDYINMHGTSTPLNDKTETGAVKLALGNGNKVSIPCNATKSIIGHPQGASGSLGVVATILQMKNNFLHPTINLENPDPECDLDYVANTGRSKKINTAICNCMGFGSKNSALVVRDYGS